MSIDLDALKAWRSEHPARPLPRDSEVALVAEVERLRAEVEWLRSPVLHTEPCANCGHTKFHHHDYRDGATANDRTRCWGAGFDHDDCAERCQGFVRFTHDARKP